MKTVFTVLFVEDKQIKCVDFDAENTEGIKEITKNKVLTKEEFDKLCVEFKPVSEIYSKEVLDGLMIGYQYTEQVKKIIYEYFQSKPISEVEVFISQYFENKDAYLNTEGIKGINEYLMNKCPRKESKPILEQILNGGVLIYYFEIEN